MNSTDRVQGNVTAVKSQEELVKDFLIEKGYSFVKELGGGDFSKVVLANSEKLKKRVAIKILRKINGTDQINTDEFEKEIKILQELKDQKYVLQIIEKIQDDNLNIYAIVTEFCDSNLTSIFELNKFNINQVYAMTYQLVSGLLLLQEKGILHSDIKPDNILFSRSKNQFKIADYGLSMKIKDKSLDKTMSSLQGNIKYMSPEVLQGQKPYNILVDVYSVGLLIIEALLQQPLDIMRVLNLKCQDLLQVLPNLERSEHQDFIKNIVSNMVNNDRKIRFYPKQLLQSLEQFRVDEACLKDLKLKKDFENEKKLKTLYVEDIEKQLNQSNDYSYDILEIDLSYQIISDEQLKLIAQYVKNCVHISQMFLSFKGCMFETQGINILENSIKILDLSKLKINLSGCKIGDKGCESLATALSQWLNLTELNLNLSYNKIQPEGIKRITNSIENHNMISQLSLNFSQNNLNTDSALLIAKIIENYKNVTELSLKLKRNRIGYQGAVSIIQHIKSNSKLTSLQLDLSNCDIGTKQSELMFKKISEQLSTIYPLLLNFKNNESYDDLLKNLCKTYKQESVSQKIKLKKIKKLICFEFDDSFQISPDEANKFANILKSINSFRQLNVDFRNELKGKDKQVKNISNIEQIIFCVKMNNNIFNALLEAFNVVQICEQFTHLNLNLDSLNIDGRQVQQLADIIKERINLTDLNLIFNNNSIQDDVAGSIANAIQNLSKLTVVTLGFRNCHISGNGIKCITNSLEDKKNITELNLDFSEDSQNKENFLNKDEVLCISNTLQKLEMLVHISISLNWRSIKIEGADCLSNALKIKKNISHLILNLGKNQIGDEGAKRIVKSIKEYQKVTELNLDFSQNNINLQGVQSIANSIGKQKNVTELNLNFTKNLVGSDGAKQIANAIAKCQNVTQLSLNFSRSNIGNEGVKNIVNSIQNYKNDTVLNLNFSENMINQHTKEDSEKKLKEFASLNLLF